MNPEIQQVAVHDLLPNPFRNIKHYEIHEEKVEQLISSFNSTGVWPTIVARPAAKNGTVEIAFGHHRREALLRRYKRERDHKVNVNVISLSDEEMLKMMAAENQEEFHSSFFVIIETIEAVINAAKDGKIELREKSSSSTHLRATTIGRFLGWLNSNGTASRKVEAALRALRFIREGILARDDFRGLSEEQSMKLLASTDAAQNAYEHREGIAESLKDLEKKEAQLAYDFTRRKTSEGKASATKHLEAVRKEKESFAPKVERVKAKTAKTMKAVVEKVKAGKVSSANIREATLKEMGEKRFFKGAPHIEQFTTDLCHDLFRILNDPEDKERLAKIRSLAENRTDVGEERISSVKSHLDGIAERALDLSLELGPLPPKLVEVRKLLALRYERGE